MTELVWDGKYTADGKRVAPLRVALPFQTVETVNESAQQRQLTLESLMRGSTSEWRNRLIWGDKKYVLPSLLPELAGKVDLIYIDPPFDTGADFSCTRNIPDSDASFTKEPSMIEQKAYRDTWGHGLDGYLQWFYETVVLLHELLTEDGTIYVHLDSHVSHYAKTVLDEVFGGDSFRNELIWRRTSSHNDARRFADVHDCLLYYARSKQAVWNPVHASHNEKYLRSHYSRVDSEGRPYRLDNIIRSASMGPRPNLAYEYKGFIPQWGWRVSRDKLQALDTAGRITWVPSGTPYLVRYLDEMPGSVMPSMWDDIPPVNSQAQERVGYPTQKPETLLERIITASSDEDDLVLDCFCGSGTTAVVAEKLGRRWITCDLGRFAIQTTRKRLLSIPDVRPFAVQNLGKYERQAWQAIEFAADGDTESASDDARPLAA